MWYEPLLQGFCERRKIEISLEHQGFQRLQKKRPDRGLCANKNSVGDSALDGIGIGLGFTCSLTLLGLVREILGSGSAFGFKFIEGDGILAFVLAPGAFMALGYLIVIFRKLTSKK